MIKEAWMEGFVEVCVDRGLSMDDTKLALDTSTELELTDHPAFRKGWEEAHSAHGIQR